MNFHKREIIVLWIVLLVTTGVLAQTAKPICAFLPFQNKSGFENKNWKLERDIPQVFSDSLLKSGLYQVTNLSRVEDFLAVKKIRSYQYTKPEILNAVASSVKADYLIIGEIKLFDLNRMNIGDPMFGGFESYKSEMEVSFSIYNRLDGTISDSYSCKSEISQKDLGLTFVGRPSKNYVSFEDLDKMEFNSPQFKNTILGAGLNDLVTSFFNQLTKLIPVEQAQNTIKRNDEFFEALIVFKRENEVYFNAGFAEKVNVGGVYQVYTKGEKIYHPISGQMLGYTDKLIGKVKVSIVKDNHLSLAKIIEEIEPIKIKDKIRIEKN